MRIEKVTEADAEELLKIYRPYVEQTAVSFEYETPHLVEFEGRIRKITEKFPYLKAADEDGSILGYSYANTFKERSAYAHCAETTIYLRKDVRRQGIGSSLYTALEEECRKIGIRNLYACIACLSEPGREDPHLTNDSVFFHQAMAYRPAGTFRRCGYKFDTWYDMVWMEKFI